MLSILIVDDTPEKITAIQELVKNSGISTEPVIVNDLRKQSGRWENIYTIWLFWI